MGGGGEEQGDKGEKTYQPGIRFINVRKTSSELLGRTNNEVLVAVVIVCLLVAFLFILVCFLGGGCAGEGGGNDAFIIVYASEKAIRFFCFVLFCALGRSVHPMHMRRVI